MQLAEQYDLTSQISETPVVRVYRGHRLSDGYRIVAKVLRDELPSELHLAKLRHEYRVLSGLQIPGVIRPHGLERAGNGLCLILDDAGNDSLIELIRSRRLTLGQSLRVALNLTETLAAVHEQGVVHKDLKPHHVFVHGDDDLKVTLIDFGISTHLTEERQGLAPLHRLEGSIPYMAPEQTGRMNRVVDKRSDLYSLGVVLYELLTGQLPFVSNDITEVVSSHLSRTPFAPHDLKPAVPAQVSALVMKLLNKMAEDRYQSARGVAHDLRRCLDELDLEGEISAFSLGAGDRSERLRLPQKLYGRDAELKQLRGAFERITQGSLELVLVSGPTGIGKSVLVSELCRHLPADGSFASGKFEQLERSIPYAALASACGQLTQTDLAQPQQCLEQRKLQLADALGPNGGLMAALVPELELALGPQPEVACLGPAETRRRFEHVFLRYLGVYANPESPLVLFLDDLQWADTATMDLLQQALTSATITNLLVIGAYRDGELSATHPALAARDAAIRANITVTELHLGPLSIDDAVTYLRDALGDTTSPPRQLADLLLQKTKGNPFFLGQLLTELAEQRALRFDEDTGRWDWTIDELQRAQVTDNVVGLIVERLRALEADTQNVLQVAACVGHEFDTDTLNHICEQRDWQRALWDALREGLLVPLDGNYRYIDSDEGQLNARFRFAHDRVREAAYQQVDADDRARTHLAVGRRLLSDCDGTPTGSDLFDVVDHFNRSSSLISDSAERRRLARLNLAAGRQARASAACEQAERYLTATTSLLGEAGWNTEYQTLLDAHLLLAECASLRGGVEAAFLTLDLLESKAKSIVDRVPARNLRAGFLTNYGRLAEAVDCAIETIRLLDEPIPAIDDADALGERVGVEFAGLKEQLSGCTMETWEELPQMKDPRQLALLETYAKVIPAAFQSGNAVMPLVVLRAARAQLEHGRAPLSPFLITQLGLVTMLLRRDHTEAYEYGKLGISMAEAGADPAMAVPGLFIFSAFLAHWQEPVARCVEHLKRAYRLAVESGDIGHVCHVAANVQTMGFYAGDSLEALKESVPQSLEQVRRLEDVIPEGALSSLQAAINALRGDSRSLGSLDSDEFDTAAFQSKAPPAALTFYGAVKAAVAVVAGEFEEALRVTEAIQPMPGLFYNCEYRLYHALAAAALGHADRLAEDLKVLEEWAQVCPANHAHRFLMARAEQAVLEEDMYRAVELYDEAISTAAVNGFQQHVAIANERCAEHLIQRGRRKIARPYLNEALYAYERWGATAKAQQLGERYGDLLGASDALGTTTRSRSSTTNLMGAVDLNTVLRAMEVLASELVVERVIANLLEVLVQNAGAQRGYLILEERGHLQIVAGTDDSSEQPEIGLSEPVGGTRRLAASVVRFAVRTNQPVVVDDATTDGRFRQDAHVLERCPRSVLCVPLTHRGRRRGLLYLENNVITHAFTPGRLRLVGIIGVQAAAAIENATLYGELSDMADRLRKANETLEAQVSTRTEELEGALASLWGEMDLARKLQTVLLPGDQRTGPYDVAAIMQPADSVGGDYYDIIETERSTWVVIGDVSGHGVSAGLIMMMFQTATRAVLSAAPPEAEFAPAHVLERVNAAVSSNLERVGGRQYMTVAALELSGPKVRFAGMHLDLLVFRARSETVEVIPTQGVWLGVLPDIVGLLSNDSFELNPGDIILLYTDGLTELAVGNGLLGTEPVVQRFQELARSVQHPAGIVQGILALTGGRSPSDDITIMAVRYDPQQHEN